MLVISAMSTFAQDIITTKTGDEIQSVVLKVGTDEVEYKKWSNQDGPVYVIGVDKIFMIKYQNGEKDVFTGNSLRLKNRQMSKRMMTQKKKIIDS